MPNIEMVPVPCEVRIDGRLKYRRGAMVTREEHDTMQSAGLFDQANQPATPKAPAPPFVPGVFKGNYNAEGKPIPAAEAPKPAVKKPTVTEEAK